MTYSTVLVLQDPLEISYRKFFKDVFERISPTLPGIDVWIVKPINHSNELDFVLQETYQHIRNEALRRKFPFDFGINVLWNASRRDWYLSYRPADEETVEGLSEIEIACSSGEKYEEGERELRKEAFGFQQFDVGAVGGTFDHLHDGHKILVSMAAFVTKRHLIVGVTGPEMLKKKKFAEAMEPIETRVSTVSKFLQEILPKSVNFSIYQIDDVCGPTGYLKNIDALIISEETVSGADFVNDYRSKQGFHALEVVTIGLLEASSLLKVSSTDMREQELKRREKRGSRG